MHRCLLVTTVVIIQLAPSLSSYEHGRDRFLHPFILPERSLHQKPDTPTDDIPRSRHKLLDFLRLLPPSNVAVLLPELEQRHIDHEHFSKIIKETDDGHLQLDFQKINTKKKALTAGIDEDDDEDEEEEDGMLLFRNPGAKRKATRSPPTDPTRHKYVNSFDFKRSEGPSLSIVNPLDVLRQRMMLEMARRRMKESQVQIAANAEYLDKLGKRSVDSQVVPLYSLSYHRPNHNTQQDYDDQESQETRSV